VTSSITRAFRFLLFLMTIGRVAHAQTFSADVVTTTARGANTRRGRVFVSNNMVRIETPDIPSGFFLVDSTRGMAWFVRPEQRLFMDARLSSPLTRLLVTVDPEKACQVWQTMEANAIPIQTGSESWTCELLASESRDERPLLRYRVTSRQQQRSDRWVDPALRFPVRVEGADGAIVVLEHPLHAPQPATLFAIPPDYRKFDPLALLLQIKQSDVWVEPPRQ
jgi:hypothetical protein